MEIIPKFNENSKHIKLSLFCPRAVTTAFTEDLRKDLVFV